MLKERACKDQITIGELKKELERQKIAMISAFEEKL